MCHQHAHSLLAAAVLPSHQRVAVWLAVPCRHASSADDQPGSSAADKRMAAMKSRLIQHEYRSATFSIIVDPYQKPAGVLQPGVLLNPVKLYRLMVQKIKNRANIMIAYATANKNIPGHDASLLADTIAGLYCSINRAQADFQLDRIKDVSKAPGGGGRGQGGGPDGCGASAGLKCTADWRGQCHNMGAARMMEAAD